MAEDLSVKDILFLLSQFSGSVDENVDSWLNQAEIIQLTYRVDDRRMKIIFIRKLSGRAKTWFHSKAENLRLDLGNLCNEFKCLFST